MSQSGLQNITMILVRPKYPGNIGSVARAMNNMGLRELRLVSPQCRIDVEALRMARGGTHILEKARKYGSLGTALRGVRLVVGTSGKTGGNREQTFSPRILAPRLLAQALLQKVGILFGPEDTGLVDDDLLPCQMLMRIPTDPQARSINLAQAVMIIAYELFLAGLPRKPLRLPRLAATEQLEAMYSQLEASLLEIGFLHPQNTRHMMFVLRRIFGRAGLEGPDVGVLRGIARQIAWFSHSRSSHENSSGPGGSS
jgi:tRNA/rRNA methyltransferase